MRPSFRVFLLVAMAALCGFSAWPQSPQAVASPHPIPRGDTSPTPSARPTGTPVPSVTPAPTGTSAQTGTPAPNASPSPNPALELTADVATILSPDQADIPEFPAMPVSQGDSYPSIGNRRLDLIQSNSLGMSGPSLLSLAPNARRASDGRLLDPGGAGDKAAWRLANDSVPKTAGRWLLVKIRGSFQDKLLEWQRLLDRTAPDESVYFKVFSRYPGGGVKDEQEYHDGQLWQSVSYDSAGNPLQEYQYISADGGAAVLRQYTEYRRRDSTLLEVGVRDPAGKLIQATAYDYTLDGRVRQTEKLYPDGHRERFLFRYGSQGLEESWQDDTKDGIHWIFDSQGRLTREEDWQGGAEAKRIVVTWVAPQGSRIASRETINLIENQSQLEVFDESNRLVQLDELRKNELFSRTSQVWNNDGTLAERQTQSQGRLESWFWEYAGGQKTQERYSKDGVPVRVTKYLGKDRSDELYLDGKPILRVFYRDNHRYKEEELRNGQTIRTRTFK